VGLVGGRGAAADWVVQTSVDWIHLLPGVSAIALLLIGLLVRRPAATEPGTTAPAPPAGVAPGRPRVRTALVSAAVALALVVTALSLSRQGLADYFRNQAQDALATNPADALRQADSSLRLDGDAVASYYVRAAALARFNRGPEASTALVTAAAKEPRNFLTWALLGDLAVRRRQLRLAKAYYTRAHMLNPRDETLGRLAVHPTAAGSNGV
jgi:tetratricopeptide (TPR) repeat protein